MVEAKAGSGKTSTIIRCYLQGGRNGKSIFLAFNKASGPGTRVTYIPSSFHFWWGWWWWSIKFAWMAVELRKNNMDLANSKHLEELPVELEFLEKTDLPMSILSWSFCDSLETCHIGCKFMRRLRYALSGFDNTGSLRGGCSILHCNRKPLFFTMGLNGVVSNLKR